MALTHWLSLVVVCCSHHSSSLSPPYSAQQHLPFLSPNLSASKPLLVGSSGVRKPSGLILVHALEKVHTLLAMGELTARSLPNIPLGHLGHQGRGFLDGDGHPPSATPHGWVSAPVVVELWTSHLASHLFSDSSSTKWGCSY